MTELDYKKLDKVVDELDAGGHYFVGEVAELLIKRGVTTHKQVGYISEVTGYPKRRLIEEIKVRKLQNLGTKTLDTAATGRF